MCFCFQLFFFFFFFTNANNWLLFAFRAGLLYDGVSLDDESILGLYMIDNYLHFHDAAF